jgi:small subunit ribosomal protein S7
VSRRKKSVKRPVLPDRALRQPDRLEVHQRLMLQGKKSTAERIFYGAMDMVESRTASLA